MYNLHVSPVFHNGNNLGDFGPRHPHPDVGIGIEEIRAPPGKGFKGICAKVLRGSVHP
jgi:hypothetical protein